MSAAFVGPEPPGEPGVRRGGCQFRHLAERRSTIDIRAASETGTPIRLEPSGAGGTYSSIEWPAPAVGSRLRLSAPGEALRGFDTEVAVPGPLTLIAPAAGSSAPVTLVRGTDFELTWSASAGTSYVTVHAEQKTATREVRLDCSFPASAGSGVVPGVLLDEFERWTDGDPAQPIEIYAENTQLQQLNRSSKLERSGNNARIRIRRAAFQQTIRVQ